MAWAKPNQVSAKRRSSVAATRSIVALDLPVESVKIGEGPWRKNATLRPGAVRRGRGRSCTRERKRESGAVAVIGGVNLVAGILGTLQNSLKVAELMESHRSSGVAWSKLGAT